MRTRVQRNPFKCVHDNWHMNHALECNRVCSAGTSTHVCHVCVGSSNCTMAGLLLLLLIMHTMQNNYYRSRDRERVGSS